MITPLRAVDTLAMAAARLKQAAPNSFAEFEQAFNALTAVRNAECVQAPPDGVLRAQGRALQMQEIDALLKNCSESAKALTAKMQQKEKTSGH